MNRLMNSLGGAIFVTIGVSTLLMMGAFALSQILSIWFGKIMQLIFNLLIVWTIASCAPMIDNERLALYERAPCKYGLSYMFSIQLHDSACHRGRLTPRA